MHIAVRLSIVLVCAALAFVGSFFAVRNVTAHGTHCSGNYKGCSVDIGGEAYGHYYAAQTRCCDYGISGTVRTQNMDLVDGDASNDCVNDQFGNPECDWVAHFLAISDVPGGRNSFQIGYTEGYFRDPPDANPIIFASPHVYTESLSNYCQPGQQLQDHGTPSGSYYDLFFLYFPGIEGYCPGDTSKYVYVFWAKRGSLANAPLDITHQPQPYGRFDATTEHFNNHAIEPNGQTCFGTNGSCVSSQSLALKSYSRPSDSWNLWTALPNFGIDAPYGIVTLQSYYSLYTFGSP